MAVTYVLAERDAQGKVIALPPHDLVMGFSDDQKPTVDSAGRTLKVNSEFWERDTDRRYVWDGVTWRETFTAEARLMMEIRDAQDSRLTDILAVLRSLHDGMERWTETDFHREGMRE